MCFVMGPRTKMTFSPILEHKGDEDDGQHEETSIIDQENLIVDAGQMKKVKIRWRYFTDMNVSEQRILQYL